MPQDEDDSLLLPSVRDPAIDNWVELSDIGTPLCVRQSESHQTWPADVDIFSTEDGAEEDMWRLDELEVDTECEFDTQSDKSLISGTISLAGNITGSPCDFAPCVDYHETGSRAAAGGLRYNVSQLAVLEDAEDVIDSVSHARQEHEHEDSEEQLMQDMETWEMDMMESFEILDSCSEQDSEFLKFEEEEEDLDWPGMAER